MPSRTIHTLHLPAVPASDQPPLLFVHGAYVNADCWALNFLPYFADLGYDCHALDLSGHGRSEGRDCLDSFGLDDYLDDVLQVASTLGRQPIMIGHSMGATLVERAMEQGLAKAGVLLAPVPPTGTQGSALNLGLRQPRFFAEIDNVTHGRFSADSLTLMRDVYFAPSTPAEDIEQFVHLIQPESQQAVAEMLLLGWRIHRSRATLPVLVVGGRDDAVFAPSMVGFTAQRWQAELAILPDSGHMLMLDRQWLAAADQIAAWLDTVRG
jgi:pimeloyl-ACP methyl ester carboxylesterase